MPDAAKGLVVVFDHRFEWLRGFHSGADRRYSIRRSEQQFEVRRLLAPQRAVVIEHGDAVGRFDRSPLLSSSDRSGLHGIR